MNATRADVLGVELDRLDLPGALDRCDEFIQTGTFAQHVAINAAKVVAIQSDPELRRIVRRCELSTADGQSVVWASKLLGDPVPERVAGIDLMHGLFARAEDRGYGVYILGAEEHVLLRAIEVLRDRHPRLRVVGYRNGYFSDAEAKDVASDIREKRPDILFVAMSSPRKEYWLGEFGPTLGVPFVMGVGGAIDVLAGHTKRAPRMMQRLGLEWLFRLSQEPRRLFRRYATTNLRFLALVLSELKRARRRPFSRA